MRESIGGGQPDSNPRLRLVIDKAKAANMPKDNIQRAIQKGIGGGESEAFEEAIYEGYGPGGTAILIETLSDNKNRTVGDVRHALTKNGGNLGASGCVAYLFEKRGLLVYEGEAFDADTLLEAALEAGAEDVVEGDGSWQVVTGSAEFHAVKVALAAQGFDSVSAELTMEPSTTVKLAGKEAERMLRLADSLEDLDDVQNFTLGLSFAPFFETKTRDLAFRTAGAGLPAFVNYNRASSRATAPFPDDFWLRPDPNRPGAVRLQIELSGFEQPDQIFFDSFVSDTRGLDGFSPIAHLTIELSEPPDPQSLPHTPIESMDPMASVGLFDVDSRSPSFGSRLPFRLEARSGNLGGRSTHALLIYPSVPLRPGGTYGIVVTRRVRAAAARPFGPSLFSQYARDTEEMPGEPEALTRVRRLAGDVLDAVERYADPPIPREDVALAVRFTIRMTDGIPSDLLAMR